MFQMFDVLFIFPPRNPFFYVFTFQDISSVIQFVTRARVQVDPDLRVVEVPNGSPEEKTVSKWTLREMLPVPSGLEFIKRAMQTGICGWTWAWLAGGSAQTVWLD